MHQSSDAMLRNALDSQARGDLAGAKSLYLALLAQDPTHVEANHKLGLLLMQHGAHAESVPFFQKALKLQPRTAEHWWSYARALLSTGHLRETGLVLDRARQSGFDGAPLVALQRQLDAALRPDQKHGILAQATLCLERGDVSGAIKAYQRAAETAPDDPDIRFRLGSLLSEKGQIAAGFAQFMKHAELAYGQADWPGERAQPLHRTKHDREQSEYLASHQLAPAPRLMEGARVDGNAVDSRNVTPELVQQWRTNQPRLAIIDNFLTAEALGRLREYCAGSTVWHRNYDAGYIGATPEAGFACPLLAQIVEEVCTSYAEIIGGHAFRYLGAFKYDSELSTGTNIHADNSAVNVNFYIAPDEANMDPQSGGMDIWDVSAPSGEAMRRYNSNGNLAQTFLVESGAKLTRVPHKANRAVIFQSSLFHRTSHCHFREGYLNKRINISMLFGDGPA